MAMDKRSAAKSDCACYFTKMNGVENYCCNEPKGLRCVFFAERNEGAPEPFCRYFNECVAPAASH